MHVARVLGKARGDEVEAGLVVHQAFGRAPGSLGRARIEGLNGEGMVLDFVPEGEAPPLRPLRLLLGFPRPIQGTRLLKDLASLGVAEIILCGTELGEKSYLESDLWKKGEYRRAILEGAEQAANPRIPLVRREWSVRAALASMKAVAAEGEGVAQGEGAAGAATAEPDWAGGTRLCLHPDRGAPFLGSLAPSAPISLAIGSERGWTDAEIAELSASGYGLASLGDRILKTETAAVTAVAIVLSRLGFM